MSQFSKRVFATRVSDSTGARWEGRRRARESGGPVAGSSVILRARAQFVRSGDWLAAPAHERAEQGAVVVFPRLVAELGSFA